MAKAKKQEALTDLQACLDELKAAGTEYDLMEYGHAYVDVLYRDAEGLRQKREFKPCGTEIHRDEYDREVA